MPSFYSLVSGAVAQSQDVQQIIDALKGTSSLGVPISLTAVSDSVNFSLAVKNLDTTNSRALQVIKANNTVLLQADTNGLVGSVDGVTAPAQLVNVSLTQTLTNKTLTAPTVTAPVISSGGLTVSAGNVGIGGAPQSQTGLLITSETINAVSAAANGILLNLVLQAQAANDVLRGMFLLPTYSDNSQSSVGHVTFVAESLTAFPAGAHISAWFGGAPVAVNPAGSPMIASGGSPTNVDLRLGNARNIGWMNAAGSDWVAIQFDGSNRFSVGAGAGATAAATGLGNGASGNLTALAKGTGTGPASDVVAAWEPHVYNNVIYWQALFQ